MKHPTLQLLSQEEAQQIWDDILVELLCISGEGLVPSPPMFANRTNHVPNDKARVRTELLLYKDCVGCQICDELGNYVCPLLWWKEHHNRYPLVRKLAQKILCIPATSAPVEQVFSSAANVIDKKRCRLNPKNGELPVDSHLFCVYRTWGLVMAIRNIMRPSWCSIVSKDMTNFVVLHADFNDF